MSKNAMSYFELNSAMGVTKHGGGKGATDELARMCKITKGSHVLVIGCGVGSSSVYISKRYGCRVTGIDISKEMVALSNKRAQREHASARFQVADAENLPFKLNTFDAVISESVTAFIPNREKAMVEYFRVTKPGGHVGINELFWTKPPTENLVSYTSRVMGINDLPDSDGWIGLMKNAGFASVNARQKKFNMFKQILNEMTFISFWDIVTMPISMVKITFNARAWRGIMRMMPFPVNLFTYWGYGLYVGKK